MDPPGGGSTPPPPPGQQPPASQPPPPQQGWQSTPQQPAPPPPAGGQPSGMPSWTSNLTDQSTMAGPGGVALAPAPPRIIALFIDFIILGIIGFIVNIITTSIFGESLLGIFTTIKVQSLIGAIVTVVAMLAITGAYFILLWTRMDGATLGMRVFKLSVRDEKTGGAITMNQAITRWVFLGAPWAINYLYGWSFGFIISLLVLIYYIYLVVSIAQSPTRQGLHDKQAKTVVVKLG
jgi:uncharacterized RDD family membrane protein YckC